MGKSFLRLALGLHLEQLRGVIEDRLLRRLASRLPSGAAEFVELRGLAAEADVFPDEVGLLQWHS